jgi:hypothetical protein
LRVDFLAGLPCQHFGIGSKVAVHGGWQFHRSLDWPVIRESR